MILGIDLGTTYSVAAFMDEERNPQVIQNNEGNRTTPSVVLFDTEDKIVVGDVAKDNSAIRPEDVVAGVKNHMGEKITIKKVGEKEYTPEMISSLIIRKVVQDAERAVGEPISEVVITVPAYFSVAQRQATIDAARIAGVAALGTINEPTAAALCFANQNNIENQRVLVYDLGGGTFDVTILDVKEKNNIEVMGTAGLSAAGGRFFDIAIVDYVCEYLEDTYDIDLQDEEYMDDYQEVMIKAEKVKIQLSNVEKASIPIKIGKIKDNIEITRADFEQMIKPTYEKTERKMKEALKMAKLEPSEIDKVLLVGGSSRIPYVVERVQQFVGKEPSREVNPAEAVAIGAAIHAETIKKENNSMKFTDVCSHSIGVVVINPKTGEEENEKIILRNSKLPAEAKQRFRTMGARQKKIELQLTEGEFKEITDVTIIGTLEIELPPNLKENELIELTISLDTKQLIHIHMELPESGFIQECQLKRNINLEEEEVENMTGIVRDIDIC